MIERYLGDGLYASFDGFMITLRAPRENGDHWVGLEPEVWAELKRFSRECFPDFPSHEKKVQSEGEP